MKDIWDAKHNTMVSIKYEQLCGSVLGYGIKQVLVHSARIKRFRIIESCYKSFIGSKSQLLLSLVQLISVEYTSKFKKNKLPQKNTYSPCYNTSWETFTNNVGLHNALHSLKWITKKKKMSGFHDPLSAKRNFWCRWSTSSMSHLFIYFKENPAFLSVR